MAKIKNCTLTQGMTNVLLGALNDVPNEVLVKWGKDFLKGGYSKAPQIKTRLTEILRGSGNIEGWIVSMIATELPYRELIQHLSGQVLIRWFSDLQAIAGRDVMLVNYLADDRAELNKLAVMEAQKPYVAGNQKTTSIDSLGELYLLLRGVILQVREMLEKHEGKDAFKSVPSEASAIRAENEALKKEVQQKKEQHQENLQQICDANKRKLDQLSSTNQQLATQLKEATAMASELQKKLDAKEKAFVTDVEAEVSKRMADTANKWLVTLETTAAAIVETQSQDVLARANEVLTYQAEQDKHSGNRLALSKRLADLKATKHKLLEAIENSINLLPGVRQVSADVDSEIGEIESILKCQVVENPTAEKLKLKIAESATYEQIDECSDIIEKLEATELVSAKDCQALVEALHQKCSVLSANSNGSSQVFKDTGWSVRGLVHKNQPTQLMIDGHNVLFSLKDVFGDGTEASCATEAARQRLICAVERFVDKPNNVQVVVFFDSPVAKKHQLTANVQIEFSGGTGENRADAAIINGLLSSKGRPEQKQFVVTNDRGLRDQSLKVGAKFVSVDVFAVLLKDFNCLAA